MEGGDFFGEEEEDVKYPFLDLDRDYSQEEGQSQRSSKLQYISISLWSNVLDTTTIIMTEQRSLRDTKLFRQRNVKIRKLGIFFRN